MFPKIAFGMIVFNGNYVLRQCLESVYPFAHQILIAEGPVSYWQKQGFITSTDGTNEVLRSFPDPENKISVVHGTYSEKDEQCNAYMQFLKPDADYIWNLDCDEIFKPEDIISVMKMLVEERYTSVGFKSFTFFGGFECFLGGFEEKNEFIRIRKVYEGSRWKTHRPPTTEHASGIVPWPEKHMGYEVLSAIGIRMYHYSYVFPQQVKAKVAYYKSDVSKQRCIDEYYRRIWLPWVTGTDETRKKIEHEFDGVHEFVPAYRGDCRPYPFTGKHPSVIQRDLKSFQREFRKQLDMESEERVDTCWNKSQELIPAMIESQEKWGKLSQIAHGEILAGLLDMTEGFLGRKPNPVVDIGCGVCPLLDLVEAERYVGVDLPDNIIEVKKVVGQDIRLTPADVMTDDLSFLSGAEVVVLNGLLDVLGNPVKCLRRVLTETRALVIVHRQLVSDAPSSAGLSMSYLGPNTSLKSSINRKEMESVVRDCGYGIAIETVSFGEDSKDPSRSFVLVRKDEVPIAYRPRTWDRPEDAGDARTESLERMAPDLFAHQSVLYVGADKVRFDYGSDFISNGYQLTVVEAWKGNVDFYSGKLGISSLIHGDISEVSFPDKSFDVVFWWHGPEHLAAEKLSQTIRRLEKMAKKMVVLGCPWGAVYQGKLQGNPFEAHRSYVGEFFFSSMGYAVECLGYRNEIGSNITAIKRT